MAKVQTYTQFAAERGLITDYDVQGHIHGGLMAAHMPKSYHRRYQKKLLELQEQRSEGLRKYEASIAAGEIERPRDLTHEERLKAAALGDPDKPSTQAAKRTLERMAQRRAGIEGNS